MTAAAEQTITVPGEQVTAALIGQQAAALLELGRDQGSGPSTSRNCSSNTSTHRAITSVVGFGTALGAQLLADTGGGDLVKTFGTSARLAAYAGLAPMPRDSGRVSGNLHRPRATTAACRTSSTWPRSQRSTGPGPSKIYYDRKRAEGKRHDQALLALARRLVDVIWALLRAGHLPNRLTTTSPTPTSPDSKQRPPLLRSGLGAAGCGLNPSARWLPGVAAPPPETPTTWHPKVRSVAASSAASDSWWPASYPLDSRRDKRQAGERQRRRMICP